MGAACCPKKKRARPKAVPEAVPEDTGLTELKSQSDSTTEPRVTVKVAPTTGGTRTWYDDLVGLDKHLEVLVDSSDAATVKVSTEAQSVVAGLRRALRLRDEYKEQIVSSFLKDELKKDGSHIQLSLAAQNEQIKSLLHEITILYNLVNELRELVGKKDTKTVLFKVDQLSSKMNQKIKLLIKQIQHEQSVIAEDLKKYNLDKMAKALQTEKMNQVNYESEK